MCTNRMDQRSTHLSAHPAFNTKANAAQTQNRCTRGITERNVQFVLSPLLPPPLFFAENIATGVFAIHHPPVLLRDKRCHANTTNYSVVMCPKDTTLRDLLFSLLLRYVTAITNMPYSSPSQLHLHELRLRIATTNNSDRAY